MKGLDRGPYRHCHRSIGTAQAALNCAPAYPKELIQCGRGLAQFQALQFKLADMLTELVAARQMVRLGAWRIDMESPDASTYARWPSDSPQAPVLTSPTTPCNCMAAMATPESIRWSVRCATAGASIT